MWLGRPVGDRGSGDAEEGCIKNMIMRRQLEGRGGSGPERSIWKSGYMVGPRGISMS